MTTAAESTTRTLVLPDAGPVELTADERGDGRPFLVLHGGAGPQSVQRFSQLLAGHDHTRVITPTHPGFGGTARPDGLNRIAGLACLYVALLDDLEVEDVTVIGNSIGGWIAAELALLKSARVGRLILLDPVGIAVDGHPVADVSALPVPEIMALSFHDPSPFGVDPTTLSDEQRAAVATNSAALAVYAQGPSMADATLRHRLSGIAIPTLVLWGDSDRIVDPEYGRAYAAAIPGAHFEVLEASGHMPQLETPDLVLAAISRSGETP